MKCNGAMSCFYRFILLTCCSLVLKIYCSVNMCYCLVCFYWHNTETDKSLSSIFAWWGSMKIKAIKTSQYRVIMEAQANKAQSSETQWKSQNWRDQKKLSWIKRMPDCNKANACQKKLIQKFVNHFLGWNLISNSLQIVLLSTHQCTPFTIRPVCLTVYFILFRSRLRSVQFIFKWLPFVVILPLICLER